MPRRGLLSTVRRSRKADSLLRASFLAMRPCSSCVSRGLTCSVTDASDSCVECYRSHRRCELASPIAEVKRLASQKAKLEEQILEAEAKALRLRRQKRAIQKKMRSLGDREEQNIQELELNKMLAKSLKARPP
jgi:hypothetical protein